MDKVEKWRIGLRESVHLEVQAEGRTRASEALVSVCGLPYTVAFPWSRESCPEGLLAPHET